MSNNNPPNRLSNIDWLFNRLQQLRGIGVSDFSTFFTSMLPTPEIVGLDEENATKIKAARTDYATKERQLKNQQLLTALKSWVAKKVGYEYDNREALSRTQSELETAKIAYYELLTAVKSQKESEKATTSAIFQELVINETKRLRLSNHKNILGKFFSWYSGLTWAQRKVFSSTATALVMFVALSSGLVSGVGTLTVATAPLLKLMSSLGISFGVEGFLESVGLSDQRQYRQTKAGELLENSFNQEDGITLTDALESYRSQIQQTRTSERGITITRTIARVLTTGLIANANEIPGLLARVFPSANASVLDDALEDQATLALEDNDTTTEQLETLTEPPTTIPETAYAQKLDGISQIILRQAPEGSEANKQVFQILQAQGFTGTQNSPQMWAFLMERTGLLSSDKKQQVAILLQDKPAFVLRIDETNQQIQILEYKNDQLIKTYDLGDKFGREQDRQYFMPYNPKEVEDSEGDDVVRDTANDTDGDGTTGEGATDNQATTSTRTNQTTTNTTNTILERIDNNTLPNQATTEDTDTQEIVTEDDLETTENCPEHFPPDLCRLLSIARDRFGLDVGENYAVDETSNDEEDLLFQEFTVRSTREIYNRSLDYLLESTPPKDRPQLINDVNEWWADLANPEEIADLANPEEIADLANPEEIADLANHKIKQPIPAEYFTRQFSADEKGVAEFTQLMNGFTATGQDVLWAIKQTYGTGDEGANLILLGRYHEMTQITNGEGLPADKFISTLRKLRATSAFNAHMVKQEASDLEAQGPMSQPDIPIRTTYDLRTLNKDVYKYRETYFRDNPQAWVSFLEKHRTASLSNFQHKLESPLYFKNSGSDFLKIKRLDVEEVSSSQTQVLVKDLLRAREETRAFDNSQRIPLRQRLDLFSDHINRQRIANNLKPLTETESKYLFKMTYHYYKALKNLTSTTSIRIGTLTTDLISYDTGLRILHDSQSKN